MFLFSGFCYTVASPVVSLTSTHKLHLAKNTIKLFPNPTKEIAFLEYELVEASNVKIELFDIMGQQTKTIVSESKQEKNKYKHLIDLREFGSGVYFIKTKFNNTENVVKLIITN